MSVLDTFYLLFEADTSKLDRGLQEAEQKGSKLTDKLGEVDAQASKLGSSLMDSIAQMGGAIAAALAFQSLASNVLNAANAADALGEASQRLGMRVEDLSAWGDAVKLSGGSVEGFIGSIETLNVALTTMDVTGKSKVAPFFKELGIDLDNVANKGKSAMDFLPQIAEAFEGMTTQESMAFGRKLGLDMGTIMMLQQGRREVDEQIKKRKELGAVTEQQAAVSAKFNDAMDETGMALRGVWLAVAEKVLPALTWMLEGFQKVVGWMSKNSDFVTGLMIALGTAIMVFVVPPLIKAAIAAAVAFAPFMLIGAAVAALALGFALLYDDIMAFVEGGESVLGTFLSWLESLTIFKAIKAELVFMWDVFKAFGQFLGGMFVDPMAAMDDFAANVGAAVDKVMANFPGLKAAVASIGEAFSVMGNIVTGVWDAIVGAVSRAIEFVMSGVNKVKGFLGMAGDTGLAEGKQAVASASSTPLAAQTSNSVNTKVASKNTSVQVGKVEVHTQATDAAGISKQIGGTMQAQMKQAAANFDDGVAA